MSDAHPRQVVDHLPAALRCERVDVGPGVVRVSLSGDLDVASAHDLDRVLRGAHDDAGIIVVDLDQVGSIAGAGAAVFHMAAERARREGRRVIAVNARAQVQEQLELAGVDRELKLVATPPQPRPAVAAAPNLPA